MSSTAGAIHDRRHEAPVERQLLTAVAGTLFVLFVGLSLVLFARRLSGAMVTPLGGGALVITSVLLCLAIIGLRWTAVLHGQAPSSKYFVRSARYFESKWWLIYFALPGIASILVLAALTFPQTPAVVISLVWFLVVGAEVANWLV